MKTRANRAYHIGAILLVAIVCASCTNLFPTPETDKEGATTPQPDRERQSLCDVERARAREDVLKRLGVEDFRQAALKVSQSLTEDEIADLERLTPSLDDPGSNTSPDWEVDHQRDQLVAQIYADAIARAGFKTGASLSTTASGLSYSIGVDSASMDGPYAEFLTGHPAKDPTETIAEVGLAASPDQTRYYIDLYRVARVEPGPDGAPVLETESLYENASEEIPRDCDGVASTLDLDSFNTIPALDAPAPAR